MTDKLYIEYRVYFAPNTNQDLLHEIAEVAQERIYNLFDGVDESSGPMPSPHDVTFEIVREIPNSERLDAKQLITDFSKK